MRAFRDFLNGIEALWLLVDRVTQFPTVQGVVVEPHPLWRLYWNLFRQVGTSSLENQEFFPEVARLRALYTGVIRPDIAALVSEIWHSPDYEFGDFFRHTKIGDWLHDHLKRRHGAPILVRIVLRPPRPEESSDRSPLREIVSGQPLIVVLEERPRAELALASGDEIRGPSPGTVGGFLQHVPSSTIYGVTCGHVASARTVSDASGTGIGSVSHATVPTAASAGSVCNRRASVNTLDASLISLASAAVAGSFAAVTTNFGTGQRVTMRGQKSGGPHNYEIGGLAVIQSLHQGGSNYCFKDLFEVRPLPTLPIPIRHATAFAHIPLRGDSGAFIGGQNASGGQDWCGMLVGTDHVCGYAIEADEVFTWAQKQQAGTWQLY